MAIVKFVTSDCPMNNIFPYVMRKEATEQRLVSGIECSPDTALEEFRYVKQKYGKEDGRTYYHIVQSFAPDDELTPEMCIRDRSCPASPSVRRLVRDLSLPLA